MIKESIQEEDIPTANIYLPSIGAPQYMRQILIDRRRLIVTRRVGDFNIISMGRLIIHTENQYGNTVEHIKPNGLN